MAILRLFAFLDALAVQNSPEFLVLHIALPVKLPDLDLARLNLLVEPHFVALTALEDAILAGRRVHWT